MSDHQLLLFNYVMDEKHPLLSHQAEAAIALARKFDKVTVITGKVGFCDLPENVNVISSNWVDGQPIFSAFRFIRTAISEVIRNPYDSVFFHMTDVQCALMSPYFRFKKKKQALWYAHTYKSNYLRFSSFWVNFLITSTKGSIPINSLKVKAIGQAIDSTKFQPLPFEQVNLSRLIHIGRFDKSKNIDLLISESKKLRKTYPELQLRIIGSTANHESIEWANIIKSEGQFDADWLYFHEGISRSEFPTYMRDNGVFFHAYTGSLDKTLIEATFLRAPVVTINPAYLEIFGSWSNVSNPSLKMEYESLRSLDNSSINLELERRLALAIESHSLDHWTDRIFEILQ